MYMLSFVYDLTIVSRHEKEIKNELYQKLLPDIQLISRQNSGGNISRPTTLDHHNHVGSTNTKANVPDEKCIFNWVYQCLHTRKKYLNITGYRLDGYNEPSIDLAILEAFLNGKSITTLKRIVDILKNNILCFTATSSSTSSTTDYGNKITQVHLALKWNRVDIIRSHILKTDEDWSQLKADRWVWNFHFLTLAYRSIYLSEI
jgi:hypothetical protein